MTTTLEDRSPNDLLNHPLNLEIYGDERPDPELVESVKQDGIIQRIVILPDGTVISGHRRKNAARVAGLKSVPVEVRSDLRDSLQIERLLIVSNKQRIKTNEQLAREAAKVAAIEEKLAAQRQKKTQKTSGKSGGVAETPTVADDAGKTREKVAKAIGVKPDKARALIAAGKALNAAESAGDEAKAEAIKEGLAKSAAAGAKAATTPAPTQDQPLAAKLKGNAERLVSKLSGDFTRAADALSPLVNVFDEIKSADPSFTKRHKELLGHHSRLFDLCEQGRKALAALKAAWVRK